MALVAFRFDATPPSHEVLLQRLRGALGTRLYGAIDSVELGVTSATQSDQVVWVLSQDLVALTYAKEVCSDLGAVRVDPKTNEQRDLMLPTWARTPWREHAWSKRLKIRFGRLSL